MASRTVKTIGWILGGIALVLVAGAVAVKMYVTKERVLGWVVPPMERELGRNVVIRDVEVGLTSFDLVGLDIRAEGATEPLAAVDRAQLSWKLWPLLERRLEVGEVLISAPTFHVIRNEDGTLDIDDLFTKGKKEEGEAAPTSPPPESGEPLAVLVEAVRIDNGRFAFEDRAATPPVTHEVHGLNLSLTGIDPNGITDFDLSLLLGPLGDAAFTMAGTADARSQSVVAKARLGPVPLPVANPYLTGGLRFAAGSALLQADLVVKGGTPGPTALELVLQGMALTDGKATGTPTDVALALPVLWAEETLTLDGTALTIAGDRINVGGTVRPLATPAVVRVRLDSARLDVDRLTAILPPGGADEGGDAQKAQTRARASRMQKDPEELPVDAEVDVRIGTLLAAGYRLDDLTAKARLARSKLTVTDVAARFYEGTLAAGATATLSDSATPFTAKANLAGVSMAALLPAVNAQAAGTMTGTLAADLTATGAGGDKERLKAIVKATIADGALAESAMTRAFAALLGEPKYEKINFYTMTTDAAVAENVATLHSLVIDGHHLRVKGKGTYGLADQAVRMAITASVPSEDLGKLVKEKRVLDALADDHGFVGVPITVTGTAAAPHYGLDEAFFTAAAEKAMKNEMGKQLDKAVNEKLKKKIGGAAAGQVGDALKNSGVERELEKVIPGGLNKLFGQ